MASSSYNAVNNLNETIGSFKSKVDVKIDSVNTSTASIRQTTDKIYNSISKFKQDMIQNEEKQLAHENILRIDQILKEQFGDHETIRKTVMGVVKDFDINLVRNSTIQEIYGLRVQDIGCHMHCWLLLLGSTITRKLLRMLFTSVSEGIR